MKLEICECTPESIRIVSENLREVDEVEAYLLTAKPPHEALRESVEQSVVSYCGHFDGTPGGIFGVAELTKDVGVIWMVGTHLMSRYSKAWLMKAPSMLALMHNHYPVLTNIVYNKNAKAVRWLHRLGFEFSPYAVPDCPGFIQFTRYAEDV